MTVCYGFITCAGNWDLLPLIAILGTLAVVFAASWRKWAICGYALLLMLLFPVSRSVQSAALFPIALYESFKYGFYTTPSAIPTLLLIIVTFVAAAYAPMLKERNPAWFMRIVIGVGTVLFIVFCLLVWREKQAELAWFAGMMD